MAERGTWICEYTDSNWHRQKWTLWYDEQNDVVWWCSAWSDFLNVSDVCARPDCIMWFSDKDTAMRRPRYTWYKMQEIETRTQPHGKRGNMRMSRRVHDYHSKSSYTMQ